MRQEDRIISSKKVGLKPLAAPDVLDFTLPDQHCCLISDDGSLICRDLALRLSTRGWRVVLLRYFTTSEDSAEKARVDAYTDSLEQFPSYILSKSDETAIQRILADITTKHGPVAVFIHLHPHFSSPDGDIVTFHKKSEDILKQVFVTAKYLQPMLTTAAQYSTTGIRACFMTVMQLDGGLGIRGERDIDVIAGGLSGLTKTLALEWPEVYCRAVDVSPTLASEAVNIIIAELFDPNRLIRETGWHETGRVTPVIL